MNFKPYTDLNTPDYRVKPKVAGRIRKEDVKTFPFKAAGIDYTIVLTNSPQREGAFLVSVYDGRRHVGSIKGWVYSQKEGIDAALGIINADAKQHINQQSSSYSGVSNINEAKKLLSNFLMGGSNDEVHGIGVMRTETDNTEYIEITVRTEKGIDYIKDLFPDNKFRGYNIKTVVREQSVAQSSIDGGGSISKAKLKKYGKYLGIAVVIGLVIWGIRYSMSEPTDLGLAGGAPAPQPMPVV